MMKIRLTCVLVVVVALASGLFTTAQDAAEPKLLYTVSTLTELQAINNDLAGLYVLNNDIDASDTVNWNGGQGFIPIGDSSPGFTGQFDGQLHTIHNLYINRPGAEYQGLFGLAQTPPGATDRCVIENLRLVDAQVTAGLHSGTLVGGARNALVKTCGASGVFLVRPDGSTDAKCGGLIGHANWGSDVQECFAAVTVDAGSRVQVGGLIGYLRGVEAVTTLSNSYSRLPVLGTGWKQGNLLGDADGSNVDRCYSSGSGKALIGFNYRDPVITNSFWDSDTGAASSTNGGTPKTTAEMMLQATYVGWDFATVWEMVETQTYPGFQTLVPVQLTSFTVD